MDNIFGFIDEILFTPGEIFRFVRGNFQICPGKFSDLSWKIFRFVWEDFQICLGRFSDLSREIFKFVRENFQICSGKATGTWIKSRFSPTFPHCKARGRFHQLSPNADGHTYGRHKKNCFFLLSVKRGAGGLGQIKKYLSENTQIFFTKGGGGLTQSKRVLSDFLA